MGANNNPEKPSWKLCGLLIGISIITFVISACNPQRSLNNSLAAMVWLVYMLIAIGLDSWPLAFTLIGMCVGGILPPVTHGQPGEAILMESATAFQAGCIGFLVGCIPSLCSAAYARFMCVAFEHEAGQKGTERPPQAVTEVDRLA